MKTRAKQLSFDFSTCRPVCYRTIGDILGFNTVGNQLISKFPVDPPAISPELWQEILDYTENLMLEGSLNDYVETTRD